MILDFDKLIEYYCRAYDLTKEEEVDYNDSMNCLHASMHNLLLSSFLKDINEKYQGCASEVLNDHVTRQVVDGVLDYFEERLLDSVAYSLMKDGIEFERDIDTMFYGFSYDEVRSGYETASMFSILVLGTEYE